MVAVGAVGVDHTGSTRPGVLDAGSCSFVAVVAVGAIGVDHTGSTRPGVLDAGSGRFVAVVAVGAIRVHGTVRSRAGIFRTGLGCLIAVESISAIGVHQAGVAGSAIGYAGPGCFITMEAVGAVGVDGAVLPLSGILLTCLRGFVTVQAVGAVGVDRTGLTQFGVRHAGSGCLIAMETVSTVGIDGAVLSLSRILLACLCGFVTVQSFSTVGVDHAGFSFDGILCAGSRGFIAMETVSAVRVDGAGVSLQAFRLACGGCGFADQSGLAVGIFVAVSSLGLVRQALGCVAVGIRVTACIAGASGLTDRCGLVGVTVAIGVRIGTAVGCEHRHVTGRVIVGRVGDAYVPFARGYAPASLTGGRPGADRVSVVGRALSGNAAITGRDIRVEGVDASVAVVVNAVAGGFDRFVGRVVGQVLCLTTGVPHSAHAQVAGFSGAAADAVLVFAQLVGYQRGVRAVHQGGAVVVNAIADFQHQRRYAGVEFLAVCGVGVTVAVRVVVAEVELAIVVEIGRVGASQLLQDDGNQEVEIHVGYEIVAVEVRVVLLHQAEAVGTVRVRVGAGDRVGFSQADATNDTIGQTDLESGETGSTDGACAVLHVTVRVDRALVLGDRSRKHQLSIDQHFALDVLDIYAAVEIQVSGRSCIGLNCRCRTCADESKRDHHY